MVNHRERISQIYPTLVVNSLRTNDEGLVNDVVIVNEDTVFRFAKNEYGVRVLANELRVMNLIRNRIELAVPEPFYRSEDAIAYPLLDGITLSRNLVLSLGETDRQAVADQLGRFLRTLHTFPLTDTLQCEIAPTPAPCRYADWIGIRQQVEEHVWPLLMAHQRTWAQHLFDNVLQDPKAFDYASVLIHGDLGPYHLLFDDANRRLTGILDFGVAGLGDSALDIGILLNVYGETFVSLMLAVYPEMEALLPRARFYAQTVELQWVLAGIKTGETFWFTAHLGNAKDLRVRL